MLEMFGNNIIVQLIQQSDAITKLVLLLLLIMSIFCWAIFLYKVVLLSIKKRQMRDVIHYVKRVQTFDDLRALLPAFGTTYPGYIMNKTLTMLKLLAEKNPILAEEDFMIVRETTNQAIDELLHHEESYLPVLSGSAAVSPLLGLFGTVWGLIHAFVRIAEKQQADITTVAPGIAEALITTLAGLIVAIPALVMFHYLTTQIRHLEHNLITFADEFDRTIQKLFMR